MDAANGLGLRVSPESTIETQRESQEETTQHVDSLGFSVSRNTDSGVSRNTDSMKSCSRKRRRIDREQRNFCMQFPGVSDFRLRGEVIKIGSSHFIRTEKRYHRVKSDL